MALALLDSQVEGLRAKAASIQRSLGSRRSEIDRDGALSDQGKQEQKQQLSAVAKEQLTTLREQEKALVKGKIRELERDLDSMVGNTGSDVIAFRDAQDRAGRLEDQDHAKRILAQAMRNNDKSLASAIFRTGLEKNWYEVRDLFIEEHPMAATTVAELGQLQRFLSEGGLSRAATYGLIG
ncbi:hypothetical protein GTU71_02480 [Rathayibacter sp. VKM Ac-2762]|uniref:hypothetical protein n=1 Tax=Rathayibacter sp. VKM Ac-2762 TaxID=2609254 RepID=UPI00132EE9DC|nr:hypothetical protein [Rathayibacter sp. VKM Ac-2762]QHF19835.1 hypothetical protein GTU71_02480 [Rathayibacter sp. VKM Ac-2762]